MEDCGQSPPYEQRMTPRAFPLVNSVVLNAKVGVFIFDKGACLCGLSS